MSTKNVDEISVKLSCASGEEEPMKNAIFSWEVVLEDEEVKQLFNKESVRKQTDVKLITANGDVLWPKDWVGIRLNTSKYGKSLSVTYIRQKGAGDSENQLILNQRNYEEIKFVCSWSELEKSEEKEIYRSGVQKGLGGLFTQSSNAKLALDISLGNCFKSELGGKPQCNLKVTTNETF